MANPGMQAFGLTGDAVIDATTHGYRWLLDTDRAIDWSVSGGFSGEFWIDPATVALYVNEMLSTFSYYANIEFNYVGSGYATPGAAHIAGSELNVGLGSLFAPFSSTSVWAMGFYPDASFGATEYPGAPGDVFLNIDSPANFLSSYEPGSAGWFVAIHELGHALGLKHPHDNGGTPGRPTLEDIDLASLDADYFTIMSYNDDYNPDLLMFDPATPMILDVLALQYMYGENTTTNAGDSVFALFQQPLYVTIWDASGSDMVSAAAETVGWSIVLPELQLSSLVDTRAGAAVPTSQIDAPLTLFWLAGDIEHAAGGSAADMIQGSSLGNTLVGIGGSDTIDGFYGQDVIAGGDGADLLYGGEHADIVVGDLHGFTTGNEGADRQYGGGGADYLNGGSNADIAYGDGGQDWVEGEGGADTLLGNIGDDFLHGGDANDMLYGNDDNDVIVGGLGEDRIYGGTGNDRLLGDDPVGPTSGTDTIYGDAGADFISAGSGNDLMFGGADADVAVGGAGNDTFVVSSLDGVAVDSVADFAGGLDRIDLVGLTVSSGLGTALVTFSNGAQLSASNGYLWTVGDFI